MKCAINCISGTRPYKLARDEKYFVFQLHSRPAPCQQRARRGADGGAHRHPHLPPARRHQLQEDQESPGQSQVRRDNHYEGHTDRSVLSIARF